MKPIFHSVDSATKNLFSRGYTRLLLGFFSALVSFSLLVAPHEARAQAQAANGVIEGTVTDGFWGSGSEREGQGRQPRHGAGTRGADEREGALPRCSFCR